MNIEELEARLKSIRKNAEAAELEAIKEYCLSNNTVQVGDIFSDHYGRIRVEEIKVLPSCTGRHQCVYFGPELTKKLEAKKTGVKRDAYQNNAI